MSKFLKTAFAALALGLAAPSAQAIDPFFPEFGNRGIDVERYHLEIAVQPRTGRIDAGARLKIVALRWLGKFSLDLAGLTVTDVLVDGFPASFNHVGGKLEITPARGIRSGDVFVVDVFYNGRPQTVQDPTAPGDPSLQLGWFIYQNSSYVVSEPVGASTFFPANDEPTDKAKFKIGVTVPPGYTAAANGVLKSSGFCFCVKRYVWEMNDPMTTWLATVHVNKFNAKFRRTPNGTPVRVYATAATPKADIEGYFKALKMLPFLERLIGRYPFEGYGSVVVDDPVLYYALETQAMSTFPLGTADEATVVHELAHQWFGNSVSVKKWEDLWIAEGTATYFEVVWANRNDPDGFHEDMIAIYDDVVANNVGAAVVDAPEEMFTDRTYLRGAAALYALRLQVGERKFYRILRAFLREFGGGNASSADFIRTAVRESGDGSVRGLLRAWLYEDQVPDLPAAAANVARRGPFPLPDLVGLRCGRGAHRGAPATCGEEAGH
jgi:aminopeptidase N